MTQEMPVQGIDSILPTQKSIDDKKRTSFFTGKRVHSPARDQFHIICIRGHEMKDVKGKTRIRDHKCGLCKKTDLDCIDKGYLGCYDKKCFSMYCRLCGYRYRRVYRF